MYIVSGYHEYVIGASPVSHYALGWIFWVE